MHLVPQTAAGLDFTPTPTAVNSASPVLSRDHCRALFLGPVFTKREKASDFLCHFCPPIWMPKRLLLLKLQSTAASALFCFSTRDFVKLTGFTSPAISHSYQPGIMPPWDNDPPKGGLMGAPGLGLPNRQSQTHLWCASRSSHPLSIIKRMFRVLCPSIEGRLMDDLFPHSPVSSPQIPLESLTFPSSNEHLGVFIFTGPRQAPACI